jgi:hypothetical protein
MNSSIKKIGKPIIYCVNGKIIENLPWCKGSIDNFFKSNENELFRTKLEAQDYSNKCKQERKEYLLKDNNLIKELFNEVDGYLSDADRKLYKEIINSL